MMTNRELLQRVSETRSKFDHTGKASASGRQAGDRVPIHEGREVKHA